MKDKVLVTETRMRKYIEKLDALKNQEEARKSRINLLGQIVKRLVRN
jgi:hypothetical protein